MSNFTKQQRGVINACKRAGDGWAKFARSVEDSGYCTEREELILCKMNFRILKLKSISAKGKLSSYDLTRYDNI